MHFDPYNKIYEVVRQGWQSHILLTADRLRIFEHLNMASRSCQDIATTLRCDKRILSALLASLVRMGFLEYKGGVFGLTDLGRVVAQAGSSAHGYLDLHAALESHWSQLGDFVRTGKLPTRPANMAETENRVRFYLAAMDTLGGPVAHDVASRLAVQEGQSVLDLGGGAGTFTRSILASQAKARVVICERPVVCRLLRDEILPRWESTTVRPEVLAADYLKLDLQEKFDHVLLANVIHNEGMSEIRQLLRTAFSSLKDGGKLTILDYFCDEIGNTLAPIGFEVLVTLVSERGQIYTEEECRETLKQVGFKIALEKYRLSDYTLLISRKGD